MNEERIKENAEISGDETFQKYNQLEMKMAKIDLNR